MNSYLICLTFVAFVAGYAIGERRGAQWRQEVTELRQEVERLRGARPADP